MFFQIVIIIGAICGATMVIGSMLLLYSGQITLGEASKNSALSIEIINKVKISTHYPALALFVIGFIFFIAAAWFAQTKKITIEGAITSPDQLVDIELHLRAGPWKQDLVDDTGYFSISFRPHMESLVATIVAPGYEKTGINKVVNVNDNKVIIGEIDIGRRTIIDIYSQSQIPPRQSNTNTQ